MAVFAPLMITWLALIAALACLPHLRIGALKNHRTRLLLSGIAVLLVLWAATSTVWSIVPDKSVRSAWKLAAFAIGGAALLLGARQVSAKGRDRIATAILIGLLLALVTIGFELLSGGSLGEITAGPSETRLSPLSHLNRAAGLLAIFSWVAVALIWRRMPLFVTAALIAITLGLLVQLDPSTPVLAFAVAVLVFALGRSRPRDIGTGLAIIVFVAFLGAPFAETISDIVSTFLDSVALNESTIQHRLDIWAFVSERIMERPLTGWGLDASRAIPGGDSVITTTTGEIVNPSATKLPLHPHNATLQFWIELGLPGAFLATSVVAASVLATARIAGGGATRGALLAAVAAALVVGEMSFGIWQSWWLGTLWLLAAFVIASRDHEHTSGG